MQTLILVWIASSVLTVALIVVKYIIFCASSFSIFSDEFDESEDEGTEKGDGQRRRGKRVTQHIDPTAVEQL